MESVKTHIPILLTVVGTGLILSTIAFAALTVTQNIPNAGIVRAVGVDVYSDSQRTQKLSLIQWGYVGPGTKTNKTIYVYNGGSVAVGLSLTTGNWTPTTTSRYIRVSWDCQGDVLSHDQATKAILTLNVFANVTGIENFSFDIRITGTETA